MKKIIAASMLAGLALTGVGAAQAHAAGGNAEGFTKSISISVAG